VKTGSSRKYSGLFSKVVITPAPLFTTRRTALFTFTGLRETQLPDKCRVYNYKVNQWGVDDRQIEATTDFVAAALTYDGLRSFVRNLRATSRR
jgi:hypothetical protein